MIDFLEMLGLVLVGVLIGSGYATSSNKMELSSNKMELSFYEQHQELIKICEAELPRHRHCELVAVEGGQKGE